MSDLCYGKQLWDYVDVNSLIDEFIELYKNRPIINNRGGDVVCAFILGMVCCQEIKAC